MADCSECSPPSAKPVKTLQAVTIRFAGDSGDGMQLTGARFSDACALADNDIATLPDYPSEIRAPTGTPAGVSGFQLQFASGQVRTPGDRVDCLVAMNPAALKVSLDRVAPGGMVLLNEDAFTPAELTKAALPADVLDNGLLAGFQVHRVPMGRLTTQAVAELGLPARQADRSRNMFALGLVCWLFDRRLDPTLDFIGKKFGKAPAVAKANELALRAGHQYGQSAEIFPVRYTVPRADLPAGKYRTVTGNQAAALALVTASRLAGRPLLYASYPITPASEILHELAAAERFGVVTFQAEDEIAAAGAAIGAAFAGRLAATGTSGPGLSLKGEMLGLAVMAELPLVVVNVQRGGPSTGLPTKTEQSDLLAALHGRHGECPLVVLAASSPGDCFDITLEAARIAVRYMTPVIVLSDGYLAQGAEPWRVADPDALPPIGTSSGQPSGEDSKFAPYARNADLARPWAAPGTAGAIHRLGGLEKSDGSGEVSHAPANHQHMTQLRAAKVDGVKMSGPALLWHGPESGRLLVVGWGGSYGAILTAVEQARTDGLDVAACHLRCLNPLPAELAERFSKFKRVLVVELNGGQLRSVLRDRLLIDAAGYSKVQGQPLTAAEVREAIEANLSGAAPAGGTRWAATASRVSQAKA